MQYNTETATQLGLTESDVKRFFKICAHLVKARAANTRHTLSADALAFALDIAKRGNELDMFKDAPQEVKDAFKRIFGVDAK